MLINIFYILLLIFSIFFGSTFSMEGLKNTAIVYFCLYFFMKSANIFLLNESTMMIFIFSTCVICYKLALELH